MNKAQLKRIIKEELQSVLNEGSFTPELGEECPDGYEESDVTGDCEKIGGESEEGALAEAHEGDPLDELERIATIMHQAADGLAGLCGDRIYCDQVEKYAGGFSDLAERLRSALETHRDQWGSDPN